MLHYSAIVRWSEEDGEFVATIPELPGISGLGATQEEAITEARAAADLAIQVMRAQGHAVPEPEPLHDYSGQFRVRIPRTLHRRLAEAAMLEGVSLNMLVVDVLSSRLVRPTATTRVEATVRSEAGPTLRLVGGA